MSGSRLVYSTDGGPQPRGAPTQNRGANVSSRLPRGVSAGPPVPSAPADGWIRLWRVKGGRGGKTVTVITGLPTADLEEMSRELRRVAGAGGATREGAVEIQGDCRERLQPRLEAMGYKVKLAGG